MQQPRQHPSLCFKIFYEHFLKTLDIFILFLPYIHSLIFVIRFSHLNLLFHWKGHLQNSSRVWTSLSGTWLSFLGLSCVQAELDLMILVSLFQIRIFYVSGIQHKSVEPKFYLCIFFPAFLTEMCHTLLIPTPSVRQIWFLWVRIYFPIFHFQAYLLSGHYLNISKGHKHYSSFNSNIFLCIGGLPLWGIKHHMMLLALTSNSAKVHHYSLPFLLGNCHTDLFPQMWFAAL